ncbi:MAG: metallophosphoesterase [Bacteroidota bacterium]
MKHLTLLILIGWLLPVALRASNPVDPIKAGTDGPHVFYRNGQIIVKSIEHRDTGMYARTVTYTDHTQVLLSCNIPEKDDQFSFLLQDTLKVQPDDYPMPEKMIVLSDIEGDFPAFKTMLMGAKVINRDFDWIFGKGHLVLVGDYFDRGMNVTECLWLVYKLEAEAAKAGGKVHFILGNHEILNLQGNMEYVRNKYVANAALMGEAYPLWFDQNSELGRWLRTKNAVERIGDYVFCHGGISPQLARTNMTLHDINRIARQYIGRSQESIPAGNPRAIYDVQTGIFWCRTVAKNQLTMAEIEDILRFAGAKRMVIGHTLVPDLTAQYGGRVICIDLYHEENLRRGFMKTLLIEDGFCYGIDSRGDKTSVFTVTFPNEKNNTNN